MFKTVKKWVPDKIYLKRRFKKEMGYSLNLNDPKTFNEKLQWLKLYDRNPVYTDMVDKYKVKEYIGNIIGKKYIIPTLGIWEQFDDIDFNKLPDKFVLKCTHDSGGLVVCRDKSSLNLELVKQKFKKSLADNFYYMGREWPYKNIKPRIIAEQYMEEDERDYTLLGFKNHPRLRLIYSQYEDQKNLKENFYMESVNFSASKHYETLKNAASKLLKKIQFSRIDYYKIDEKKYLIEITGNNNGDILNVAGLTKLYGGYIEKIEDLTIIYTFSNSLKSDEKALIDYKFFCFDGYVESVMVCTGRETGNTAFYFFDRDWNLKRYNIRGMNAPVGFTLPKPKKMEEMFMLAEKLSQGIPFVRVDLYCINELIYFGEMTFYPDSGLDKNLTSEADNYWGSLLKLVRYEEDNK